MLKRVTGIGGILFKCQNPDELKSWYSKHLGIETNAYGATFDWRNPDNPEEKGCTQWCPFSKDTTYFQPSTQDFMINYRVENLEELFHILVEEGVTILDKIETYSYGKFLHILDLEGNKIELWEPIENEQ
jgi:predicted enzyme related to lactoylglutathione lyase